MKDSEILECIKISLENKGADRTCELMVGLGKIIDKNKKMEEGRAKGGRKSKRGLDPEAAKWMSDRGHKARWG